MINLCNTLLPIDRVQAIPADIGKTIKPTPVIDGVLGVDVAPMIMILSRDSNIVFRVLEIFYLFFDLLFLFLKYVMISLTLLLWLLKLLTTFNFFFNLCSRSIFFSIGAEGYNLFVFASINIT